MASCPPQLLADAEVSPGARLVGVALWMHARGSDQEPVVWPSRATLAEEIGVCVRTVSRHLSDLQAFGWISHGGRRSTWVLRRMRNGTSRAPKQDNPVLPNGTVLSPKRDISCIETGQFAEVSRPPKRDISCTKRDISCIETGQSCPPLLYRNPTELRNQEGAAAAGPSGLDEAKTRATTLRFRGDPPTPPPELTPHEWRHRWEAIKRELEAPNLPNPLAGAAKHAGALEAVQAYDVTTVLRVVEYTARQAAAGQIPAVFLGKIFAGGFEARLEAWAATQPQPSAAGSPRKIIWSPPIPGLDVEGGAP